uniref:Uncharacterized protein n=1 Tax=Tetranychus urticae TaxID=32264 RepID=T1KY60_TETUR
MDARTWSSIALTSFSYSEVETKWLHIMIFLVAWPTRSESQSKYMFANQHSQLNIYFLELKIVACILFESFLILDHHRVWLERLIGSLRLFD